MMLLFHCHKTSYLTKMSEFSIFPDTGEMLDSLEMKDSQFSCPLPGGPYQNCFHEPAVIFENPPLHLWYIAYIVMLNWIS